MPDFILRESTRDDAPAVGALGDVSADGGAVGFRLHQHVPVGSVRLRPGESSAGVVAEIPGVGIVGSARMTRGMFRYEGEARPYALLGSLMVHPDHRRKGIATALARWRIEQAEQATGAQTVIVAEIQRGNTASFASAAKWATAYAGPAVSAPMRMRSGPVRGIRDIEICDAADAELSAVVEGGEAFSRERDFARIWTPAGIAAWLGSSPFGDPVNHYRVALDRGGNVVAGLAVREEGRLRSMELTRIPPAVRAANVVLRVIPPDRMLRNLVVEHLWFAEGWRDAASSLVDDARWRWRANASNLLATFDARDPARSALGVRPWTPTTRVTMAVRADVAPDPARLIEPLD